MCSEEEEEQQGNGVEVPSSEEESEPEDAPLDAEDEEEVRFFSQCYWKLAMRRLTGSSRALPAGGAASAAGLKLP